MCIYQEPQPSARKNDPTARLLHPLLAGRTFLVDPLTFQEIVALPISEHLAAVGREDKACEMLMSLVVKKNQPVSATTVKALARLIYIGRNWALAIDLFKALTQMVPDDLEGHVCLSHCFTELEDLDSANRSLQTAEDLARLRGANAMSVVSDKTKEVIFEQICLHYASGAALKACQIIRICALTDPYILSMQARQPASALSDEAIRHRIEKATAAFDELQNRQSDSLPEKVPGADFLCGKKVALVMRRYFLSSADSREHELFIYFNESARALGIETFPCPAESKTPDQQYAELDHLASVILTHKPDLVVVDDLGCGYQKEEFLTRDVYRTVLCELKQQQPFKLVTFYPDAWLQESLNAMDYVEDFVDIIWHQNSDLLKNPKKDVPGKARYFYAPFPFPDEIFIRNAPKTVDCAFLGSVFLYNYPRSIWLSLMEQQRIECSVHLSNHTRTGSAAGSSVQDYAAFMSRVRLMINFSARSFTKKIVTGRVWESILSGCLLLEEDNEEIRNFFTPFVHYIPYRTLQELDAYIRFFAKNEEIRSMLAQRAFDWFKTRHDKSLIWRHLFTD